MFGMSLTRSQVISTGLLVSQIVTMQMFKTVLRKHSTMIQFRAGMAAGGIANVIWILQIIMVIMNKYMPYVK